jgi:hypothetical protein
VVEDPAATETAQLARQRLGIGRRDHRQAHGARDQAVAAIRRNASSTVRAQSAISGPSSVAR